jgi:type III secretion system FlhB-like substrate exporter
LRLDQEIPPQLYQAVAAVLAFLYRVQQQPRR